MKFLCVAAAATGGKISAAAAKFLHGSRVSWTMAQLSRIWVGAVLRSVESKKLVEMVCQVVSRGSSAAADEQSAVPF